LATKAQGKGTPPIIDPEFSKAIAGSRITLTSTPVWSWHSGKVIALGFYTNSGAQKSAEILWDNGYRLRVMSGIDDRIWEILTMAFSGSGKILTLSDKGDSSPDRPDLDWRSDLRNVEAQK
jgi:hypothetical protein